ncbi:MAG TPA: hypothetical protein VMV38_00755, partial [Candidatus Paceibacterota bacterium]|nr:hypothetical protein [Candidatus Paceibacterota bacterium]
MPANQLNVEYFFRLAYDCFHGACYGKVSVNDLGVSAWLAHLWLIFIILGYVLALAALIIIIYVLVRLFELRK